MKKALVIFFAATILVSSMSNALLVAEFKLNQAEIERLYCVNKATPEKQCHGKCHLMKELAEKNDRNGKPCPLSELELSLKINFFLQQTLPLEPVSIAEQSSNSIPHSCRLTPRFFGKSTFQPPDFQAIA